MMMHSDGVAALSKRIFPVSCLAAGTVLAWHGTHWVYPSALFIMSGASWLLGEL